MTDLIRVIAWSAVAIVAVVAVVQTMFERLSLRRVTAAVEHRDRLPGAVRGLLEPHRSIFSAFLEGLNRASTVDESLTRAMIQAAQATFAAPAIAHVLSVLATAIAVFGPILLALVTAANRMATLFVDARLQPARTRYLNEAASLRPAFMELTAACDQTAWIIAALAVVWALKWWTFRPAVREARLIKALIVAAGRLRPAASAPVATRLAEIIAPPRSLGRPAVAAVLWLVAITGGWLALVTAAQLRSDQRTRIVFDVWPTDTAGRIEALDDIVLPRAEGGAPIAASERPSLTISPSSVRFHSVELAAMNRGTLPPNWTDTAPPMTKALADFARPLAATVIGDHRLRMNTMLSVVTALEERYSVSRFLLVVERAVPLDGIIVLQAELPVEVDPKPRQVDVDLVLEDDGVLIKPVDRRVAFADEDWSSVLRSWARQRPSLHQRDLPPPLVVVRVTVAAARMMTYGRFIDVLSAVDGACPGKSDCGLPGLGTRFLLRR